VRKNIDEGESMTTLNTWCSICGEITPHFKPRPEEAVECTRCANRSNVDPGRQIELIVRREQRTTARASREGG